MADTLLNFTPAMDGLPDNTIQAIKPENVREAFLSTVTDRGAAFASGGPWTVPIPASDTWVDIPLNVLPDMVESPAVLFWRMNANGHLFYNSAADWPNVDGPSDLIRSVTLTAVIGIDPNGDTWEFAFTVDGVVQTPSVIVETANQTDAVTVTLIASQGISPFDAPVVSIQAKNNDDSTDLVLLSLSFNVRGGPLS